MGAFWLLGLLALALVLPAYGGAPWRAVLQYERSSVMAGQYWRLLSGHFVHGTSWHLLVNAAGVGLVAALFARSFTLGGWLAVIASSMAAIDVGFVFFEPQLQWYVGFSGVLHGALAAGTITSWRDEPKAFALLLTVFLLGKLAWEQWQGALPLAGGLPVVVEAHLYGALGGVAAGGLLTLRLPD